MREVKPCDGTCFAERDTNQEIKCQDGEILVFYHCKHEHAWILTTLAPPQNPNQVSANLERDE